jgi:uncharacterized protein YciI
MQFAIAAFLKPGAEDELRKYSDDFNEHLGPSGSNVLLAGALRDPGGKRVGYLAVFEGQKIADAEMWIHESPIYKARLYDRLEVYQYQVEVGRLG